MMCVYFTMFVWCNFIEQNKEQKNMKNEQKKQQQQEQTNK